MAVSVRDRAITAFKYGMGIQVIARCCHSQESQILEWLREEVLNADIFIAGVRHEEAALQKLSSFKEKRGVPKTAKA